MRKRYRAKVRSCALCKPQKRGWASRWRARDLSMLEQSEREIAASSGAPSNQRLQRTGARPVHHGRAVVGAGH